MRITCVDQTDHIDTCPYCGVNHVQICVKGLGGWSSNATCFLGSCQNRDCGKSLFYIRKHIVSESGNGYRYGELEFLYPFAGLGKLLASDLPDRVSEEFQESITCSVVGALLASMTMSRRVLQRCLKDKGHTQNNLVHQIDAAKMDGTIPKRYHEIADEIRLYGNIGAHPDDDKKSCVTSSNCHQLIGFTKLIIEELYVLPQRATLLRKNRTDQQP